MSEPNKRGRPKLGNVCYKRYVQPELVAVLDKIVFAGSEPIKSIKTVKEAKVLVEKIVVPEPKPTPIAVSVVKVVSTPWSEDKPLLNARVGRPMLLKPGQKK